MLDWRKCVQQMIDYIELHLNESLSLADISSHIGYSQFYCSRAFSAKAGICLKDYIRLRRVSSAAMELKNTKKRILDIAIEYGYGSQEAFTRSFMDTFYVSPAAYRKSMMPIKMYPQLNINHRHIKKGDEFVMLEKYMKNVRISTVTKPERKMLVWHSEGAEDYHQLCEAEGAEKMWSTLEKIPGTLGGVVAAWLNENGKSRYIWGVEVPLDYSGSVPKGLEVVEAPKCEFIKFCHPPYKEEEHEDVTEAVWNISEAFNPNEQNMEWNDKNNPVYEDDTPDEGYMVLKPIKRL